MLIKQKGKLFSLKIPTSVKIAYVWRKGLALLSNRKFRKGQKIITLKGYKVSGSISTPEALQIEENQFIDTKYLVPEDFINHSCSPNTKVDVNARSFIAIKEIQKKEEITFNYNTTEYDMKKYKTDFWCMCGSKNCLGHIKGFRYLNHSQKLKIKKFLTPFLNRKV